MDALSIVKKYYQHFNNREWEGMVALLDEQIRHEPNQGTPRIGLELFREFQAHMDRCYEEQLTDLVFFQGEQPHRIAVEFTVNGIYKATDDDLPPAEGQRYVLPAAAFLEVKEGRITRVTTYYNLPLWMQLVTQGA